MLRRNLVIAGTLVVWGSICVTASAQGPGGGMFFGRGGGGASGSMLLAIPEVQTELNLSDDQKSQIKTIGDSVREKIRSSLGNFNFQELQNLSDEERQKRFDEMRKKAEEVTKGVDEKVAGILDAKQNGRLKELQLQREGATALTRPEVAKKLGLNEEQQTKIKKIQDDARPGRGGFDPNQSQEERQAAFQKMREKAASAQKECLAVLSDDQMLDWTNMCGKTFKFPARQRGGPGGNPPGGAPTPPPQP